MNHKLFTILLIGLLSFSCLNLALGAVCPKCDGTGQIVCPTCHGTGTLSSGGSATCTYCGGTGTYTPVIQKTGITTPYQTADATFITATFKNKETVNVTATVTATLGTHSNSTTVTFPAGQEVSVPMEIPYVGVYTTMQLM